MFYVYLLKSQNDTELYVGSTNDLRRRVEEHNAGKNASTKHRTPLIHVYYEAYSDEVDARQREKMLKLRGRALGQLKRRVSQSLLTS